MSTKTRTKAGIILLVLLLLAGGFGFWAWQNKERFYPKVEEVTYLKVDLAKDTAEVLAGIQVQNRAPIPFTIDSINYTISNNGVKLGWGKQIVGERLPALTDKVLDFKLILNTALIQQRLKQLKNKDSIDLDVHMKVYIDPPFLEQKTIPITRSITTALPKGPSVKIDSFFVRNFSPQEGYTFQLNLDVGETELPGLKIEDLRYKIRLADSIEISGEVDSAFSINKGEGTVQIPVHLETAELIEFLKVKLSKKNKWKYDASVSATVKTSHRLFDNTAVQVERSGMIDTRKIGGGAGELPSVKRVQTLQLVTKNKRSFLHATLLIHNPGMLPLYIDSARYFLRYKGNLVAHSGGKHKKVLPANGNQSLKLELAVNNAQYKKLMAQPKENGEIPLEAELRLIYNLKNSKRQQLTVKEKLAVPVSETPAFAFEDIDIKQLDPEKGARLMLKLKVKNPGKIRMQLDDLNYRLVLKNSIDVTGKTGNVISIDTGTTIIAVPVNLSASDVNLVVQKLIQGVEDWPYEFSGTATVSVPNTVVQQTEVAIETSGVYHINSKGSPDYMPEISKIDTLFATIHYDTAWVRMYAAIYNTLPLTLNVTKLEVDVIHKSDTIATTEEVLNIALKPDTNTFAWHTMGINYGRWGNHVKKHENEDSMMLTLPVTLYLELAEFGKQAIDMDLSTQIPTPKSPVTLLRRLKLRGFGFGSGLKFDAIVAVQNANSEGLTVKNIGYDIKLENGVGLCGTINRTYTIPIGISDVEVPVNLSVWEALKLLKRQYLGPFLLEYKINATATMSTSNPKLKDVYVIFENHSQTNLKEEKTIQAR